MMNTLHNSLIIAFLAISIFISGLTVDLVSAQNTAEGAVSARRPADLLQSRYLRFGRLTSDDGLSNDQVRGVAQDRDGFIWISTLNGLNRYDGAGFKVYRHDPENSDSLSNNLARDLMIDRSGTPWIGTWGGGLNQYDRQKDAFTHYQYDPDDPSSLSNNITRTIYEDRAGAIWVGTMGGLNKLDRERGTFTRYLHDPENPNSLSNNIVLSVIEDSTGLFWIGTEGGLDRFDPETEQFTHYRNDPDDSTSLSHNVVRAIREDHTGNIWLATNKGLCKFVPETNGFTHYQHDPDNPLSLSNNYVTGMYEDRAGRLWVGTWGGGLNRFDPEKETFTHYRQHPSDPYSLSNNNVDSIFEDRHGMIWIATDGGVNSIDAKAKSFYHYRIIADNPNGIGNNAVRSIHAGHSGSIWIGTNGGGFFRFDRQTEQFTGYQNDPADPNSLSDDAAVAVYEDRKGLIWVGTSGHGLNRFDPGTKRYTHYRNNPSNPRSLSSDIVNFIYEDRAGTLWFGTSGGLNGFDRETGQFTRYQHDPADSQSLSNDYVTSIIEDQTGILWISTFEGLNKFDYETKTFTRYNHISSDPQSLTQDGVSSICEDRAGNLWLGTAAGLDKFDRTTGRFTHYTTAHGLPSNTIWGILEDEQGRLWISTSSKMSRFDPRTETFRTFDESDGLQSNTFYRWSAYSRSLSGEMFFGGPNGFNAFYPDQIEDDMTPPSVLISDFQLANKPVPIGVDSVLQKSILETDTLVLSYRDSVFSFELAVLNYRSPEKNRFKFRMEGFETAWTEVDSTRRFATYTHLDPGDYVFKVIGANNDGIWNEEGDAVHITVTPPWWEKMWFRIVMVTAVIALLTGGFRWRVSAGEARRRELEIQVQTMTRAKQMQAERDRILEVSQDLICIVGMDGHFKYLNPAWEKNIGYANGDLLSRKFLDFVHPDDRAKTMGEFKALVAGRQFVDFENRYLHKEGSIRHFSWMATSLPNEERVYAVGRDITRRKQSELDLNQYQQRLKALASQLTIAEENERRRIAVGLHDHVCQSLALANIQLELIKRKSSAESELADTLGDISDTLHETLKDTRQLMLELSSPLMNEIGLSAAISEWLRTQVGNRHNLKTEFINNISDSRRKTLDFDVRAILFRNVRELLVNVIKHARAKKISVRMEEKNSSLKIVVEDDGIGFEPGTLIQGGNKISGFGLFSVEELMADQGGNLKIVSGPGKGCIATLSIPFNDRHY